ncbi:MAG: SGNH/GDSL hydrolase family protein [Pontimonas sp.]|nr:SGNH/GDSL hydrolase family protein [Pontimonas sp.]
MSLRPPRQPLEAPTVVHRAAWPVALGLSPLLYAQGKWVRRQVPRLPHAPSPWEGERPGPSPLSVLGVGDSTIAGVGVKDPLHGLVPQFSLALHERTQRGVSWRSVGESGATSKDILRSFLTPALATPADMVIVSLGANDAKDLKPLGATVSRFERLVKTLHEGHPRAVLIFSALPAFYLFPTLPQPLRSIIYAHAQAIERSIRPMIESFPFAMMSPPPPGYHDTFFAVDGFHPSEDGYRDWARFALEDALERGALEAIGAR